jgi:choline dehydrogenase-like flavoprotein
MSFGCSISSAPFLAAALADSAGAGLGECMKRRGHLAVFYVMVRSMGAGAVTTLPWRHDPLVTFTVPEDDLRDLAVGLHRLGRILFAAGAVRLFPSIKGYPVIEREERLDVFTRPIPGALAHPMTIHLAGTCPMGEGPRAVAVDSFGKVRGLDNVWINDASLLPEAPGVNPMGTVLALAYRNAERFLASVAR